MMFSMMLGTGARGRPLRSCNDYGRDDFGAIGHPYIFWRKCRNQEDWGAIIKVLLGIPRP